MWNKEKFLFILVFVSLNINAQERYLETVFEGVGVETLSYYSNLELDVYTPLNDTETNRPLLLLVHGGGFSGGKRDNPLERSFSKDMASRGYIVASMSYRLTRKGKGFGCDCPEAEKRDTFLNASQDVYRATEFLIEHSASLGIDSKKIILVGSSAGAEAVLNAAFMQNDPEYSAILKAPIQFAGVISFAGALLSASEITTENAVPSLFFHGKKDRLVPYKTAAHHYCDPDAKGYILLDGSKTIAKKLWKLNAPAQLVKDPKGNHDWANIAYKRTDRISKFIWLTIINGEKIRKRVRLKK